MAAAGRVAVTSPDLGMLMGIAHEATELAHRYEHNPKEVPDRFRSLLWASRLIDRHNGIVPEQKQPYLECKFIAMRLMENQSMAQLPDELIDVPTDDQASACELMSSARHWLNTALEQKLNDADDKVVTIYPEKLASLVYLIAYWHIGNLETNHFHSHRGDCAREAYYACKNERGVLTKAALQKGLNAALDKYEQCKPYQCG